MGPDPDQPLVRSDFELNLGGVLLRIPFDVWYFSHLNSSCVQSNSGMTEVLVGDVLFRRYVVLFDLTVPHQVMLGFGLRNRSYALGTSHAVVTKHAVAKISKDGQGVPGHYPGPPLATDTVAILNMRNTQCAASPRARRASHLKSQPRIRNKHSGISSTCPSARPPNPSE